MTKISFPPEFFERTNLLRKVISKIESDESVAIWAPRYSGRTTFLESIEAHYKKAESCLAVYTLPQQHLEPDNLLLSLVAHIEHTYEVVYGHMVGARSAVGDGPNGLRDFVSYLLTTTGLTRLVLLIDDCDQLLSTSLVDLIRELRSVQSLRQTKQYSHLHQFSIVVAGAVSFRNLKLLEKDELSPFDDWPWFTLEDLSVAEASSYLVSSFGKLQLQIDHEALQSVLEYAGGDLNRLNSICMAVVEFTRGSTVKLENVSSAVEQLLEKYRRDPCSSYMISVITHDPRCLDVLAKVSEGRPKFLRTQLDHSHSKFFRISNPELSGGFLLDRDERRGPVSWRFRNRFAEEVLKRHFDTAAMMRSYLGLSRPDEAGRYAEKLERELATSFRGQIHSFDETALREIVEARWDLALPEAKRRVKRKTLLRTDTGGPTQPDFGDRVERGFRLISLLLSEIFGYEDVVLYERQGQQDRLIPNNSLPSPPFNSRPLDPISLGDHRCREVRVFASGLYTVEIEGGDHLKIVIPLKDFQGRVTGALSIRSNKDVECWANLFVRIPIVERILNITWKKLSRVEAEQVALLGQVARLAPGSKTTKRIEIFVVTEFDTELHRYLERSIRRFSVLNAVFLKAREGVVSERIINAMQSSLVLVDVTKINSNVFLELGLAIGLNRPGFLMAEEGLFRDEPRIISGRGYLPYHLRSPLGEEFLAQVRGTQLSYESNLRDESYVHILQASFARNEASASSEVVAVGHDEFNDDARFRRAVREAVERQNLKLRYIWEADDHPHHSLSIHRTPVLSTVYGQLQKARVVIARAEDIETPARASQFVAIGIAMGLEIRYGRPRVLLCSREFSPTGEITRMPSNLRGLAPAFFHPGHWRQFAEKLSEVLGNV